MLLAETVSFIKCTSLENFLLQSCITNHKISDGISKDISICDASTPLSECPLYFEKFRFRITLNRLALVKSRDFLRGLLVT